MSVQAVKRSFTAAEYRRMVEVGLLSEADRVGLIDGEVFEMSPIGKRHAACVGRLTRVLTLLLQHVALVWVQNPIRLDTVNAYGRGDELQSSTLAALRVRVAEVLG